MLARYRGRYGDDGLYEYRYGTFFFFFFFFETQLLVTRIDWIANPNKMTSNLGGSP